MPSNNRDLIWSIKQNGYLKSKKLEQALLEIPRENFVPSSLKRFAYEDVPLSLSHKQTISQPSTVVIMTEALNIKSTDKILEIGTGSGWQSAILSKLTKKNVYTIERIHKLVELGKNNIKQMNIKNIIMIEGDGSNGYKKGAPYDKIIVTAASPEIPKPLLEQLKIRGIMVIPIGDHFSQEMFVITKRTKTKYDKISIGYFNFVPLLGKYGFDIKK